ncbi:hypothetical protein Salat_2525500 [Sesamum alatum]|uniref:Uncharacterized protein n=1 Tax=Sesamum alatum TaxID=300844 RepID=A0AAE1XS00_9LAMI|nr:hypothetical protein Salat_2525500 [Sesamum alatum]
MLISSYMIGLPFGCLQSQLRLEFHTSFPSSAFLAKTEALINGLEGWTRPEDLMASPEWVTFKTKVAYRLYEANWILGAAEKRISGFSDPYRIGKAITASDALITTDCNEINPEWLKLLEELHQIEVTPLGGMPPHVDQDTSNSANKAWSRLALKPKHSLSCWKEFHGRPLILLPIKGDQWSNLKLWLKQVGVEVPTNEQEWAYPKNAVAQTQNGNGRRRGREI